MGIQGNRENLFTVSSLKKLEITRFGLFRSSIGVTIRVRVAHVDG